jgi:HD-GYP domain-containing protein (c-di-GMP phosphodiesterase class II)
MLMAESPIEQRPAGGQAMNLQRLMEDSIKVIASLVEARDPYTSLHQLRVARLAAAIAAEVHCSEDEILGLSLASAIHDIGKILIPFEILSKPGKLNQLEFNMVRDHPRAARDILVKMRFYWPIAEIVYQHHERMDGSGYPEGLKGRTILPQARILAIADVVEAMSFDRPYRAALGIDAALKEIIDKKGKHFDPWMVDACVKLFAEARFDWDACSPLPGLEERRRGGPIGRRQPSGPGEGTEKKWLFPMSG